MVNCTDNRCCPVGPVERDRSSYRTWGRCWRDYVGRDGYYAPAVFSAKGGSLSSDTLFLGVELELENEDVTNESYSGVRHLFKDAEFGIIKGDGSLDDGVEINSVPATLDEHYKFDWPNALRELSNAGFDAKSSCGIHIHISRRALKGEAVRRLAEFIYSADNFGFVRYIAGRHSASWAKYKNVSIERAATGGVGRDCGMTTHADETLEFRLFASTLNPKRFMTRLEFAAALAEYANESTRISEDMTPAKFGDWVCESGKYSYLCETIKDYFRLPSDAQQRGYSDNRGFRAANA